VNPTSFVEIQGDPINLRFQFMIGELKDCRTYPVDATVADINGDLGRSLRFFHADKEVFPDPTTRVADLILSRPPIIGKVFRLGNPKLQARPTGPQRANMTDDLSVPSHGPPPAGRGVYGFKRRAASVDPLSDGKDPLEVKRETPPMPRPVLRPVNGAPANPSPDSGSERRGSEITVAFWIDGKRATVSVPAEATAGYVNRVIADRVSFPFQIMEGAAKLEFNTPVSLIAQDLICLRTDSGSHRYEFKSDDVVKERLVNDGQTVAEVKKQVATLFCLKPDLVKLMFRGKILPDETVLSRIRKTDQDEFIVYTRDMSDLVLQSRKG
jgi:hypothetical protein